MASSKFTEEGYGRFFVGIPVSENARWLIEQFDLKMTAESALAEREAMLEEPTNLIPMPGVFTLLVDLSTRACRWASRPVRRAIKWTRFCTAWGLPRAFARSSREPMFRAP